MVINSGLHSLLAKTDFFTLAKLGPEKELIIAVFVFRREVGLTDSSCKVPLFVSITVRVSTMPRCYLETKSETGLRGQDKFSCPINVYPTKENAFKSRRYIYNAASNE